MSLQSDQSIEVPPSSWKDSIYQKLKERNLRESKPFQHIYSEYEKLQVKLVNSERKRESARHALKLLEFEIVDLLSKKDSDANSVVNYCKEQIGKIQKDLHLVEHSSSESLSKVVYDQKRMITHQVEEMRVAKSELQNALSELATLKSEYGPCKEKAIHQENQLIELKAMMQSMEALITQLKKENNSLTERLISEKDFSAKQLNEINTLTEELNSLKIS